MGLSSRDLAERMRFVRMWADYVKRTPNDEWSRQQNVIVDSVFSANQDAALYLKVKRRCRRAS